MPEYVEYLIISIAVLSLIMIGLAAFLIVKLQYITQYFNNRKFKLSMKLAVDPFTHVDKFTFTIFNNNLNDARVSDLGIGYDQESITFFKDTLEKDEIGDNNWLVIPTRDSLSIDIDVKKTYELLLERNKGVYRLKKVRIYVIDAAGFETRVRARDFVKTIKKMLKADRKLIAAARRKIRVENFKAFFDFKAKQEEQRRVKAGAQQRSENNTDKVEPINADKPTVIINQAELEITEEVVETKLDAKVEELEDKDKNSLEKLDKENVYEAKVDVKEDKDKTNE